MVTASDVTKRERRWEKSWIVEKFVRIVGFGFCKESVFDVVCIVKGVGDGVVESIVFVFVNSSCCVCCRVKSGVTIVVFFSSVESF